MKHHVGALAFLVVVAAVAVQSGDVSARPLSATGEIEITAIVPHKRHIIVNQTGKIIEITSNTSQDVNPEVFQRIGSTDTPLPLTPELYEQYRTLIPVGTAKSGVLYTHTEPIIRVTRSKQPSGLKFKTQQFSFLLDNFKRG